MNLKKGILIFTDEKTLRHKQDDGYSKNDDYCFWETNKLPKKFVENLMLEKSARISFEDNYRYELTKEFPIYFAIKGKIRGYFVVHDIEQGDMKDHWLIFYSESWHEIEDGEVLKPSQGWRYYPK